MATILHIEDNLANKVLVERVLEARSYSVLHAADGQTGIQMAIEHRPDLILIDMGLPDIDGQTVAILLRQMPGLAETPIVAITAWPPEKALEIAEKYGLDGCFLKPIDITTFPQQIAEYLRSEQ